MTPIILKSSIKIQPTLSKLAACPASSIMVYKMLESSATFDVSSIPDTNGKQKDTWDLRSQGY
jgi:hypothetical protein